MNHHDTRTRFTAALESTLARGDDTASLRKRMRAAVAAMRGRCAGVEQSSCGSARASEASRALERRYLLGVMQIVG